MGLRSDSLGKNGMDMRAKKRKAIKKLKRVGYCQVYTAAAIQLIWFAPLLLYLSFSNQSEDFSKCV